MAPNAQALTQAASTRLKLRGNEINSLGLPQLIARTQLAECAHERPSTLPDCRNHMRLQLPSKKISTLTVQRPACSSFAKLRLSPATTLLSTIRTCTMLRTISRGLQRFWASHNPLVQGSSPCGPTTRNRSPRPARGGGFNEMVTPTPCES